MSPFYTTKFKASSRTVSLHKCLSRLTLRYVSAILNCFESEPSSSISKILAYGSNIKRKILAKEDCYKIIAIAEHERHHIGPTIVEWLNKCWETHIMKCYVNIINNHIMCGKSLGAVGSSVFPRVPVTKENQCD